MSTAPPRNIVILLDGTGNQFSSRNSNLIKLMSVLKVDESQLVFYSSGLGTVLPESTSTWGALHQRAAELIDEGLAWNFDEFVCDAYQYLVDYYRSGDKVYLFGFSRGAYTARALAGMVQKVGLLPPGNHNQIKLAYDVYTNTERFKSEGEPDGKDPAVLYRRIFGISRPVTIEFLGVWDTVSSLGGIDLPKLPFAGGVSSVKVFRQALALDEKRARFAPEYRRLDHEEVKLLGKIAEEEARAGGKSTPELTAANAALEKAYPSKITVNGVAMAKSKEVWFMGCHSDVGGGNSLNDKPSLSNVPFRWMLREATASGLQLDASGVSLLPALHIPHSRTSRISNPTTVQSLDKLGKLLEEQLRDARKEAEHEEAVTKLWKEGALGQNELREVVRLAASLDGEKIELGEKEEHGSASRDILSEVHESLTAKWVLLEHLPLKTRHYTKEGSFDEDQWKVNRGDGRQVIPHQKIHRSVLCRLAFEQARGKLGEQAKAVEEYKGPAAHVAEAWPRWAAIRTGGTMPNALVED